MNPTHRAGTHRSTAESQDACAGSTAPTEVGTLDATEHAGLLAAIAECCPYAIIVHQHGQIVFANPSARTMLGHTETTGVVGRALDELIRPDCAAALCALDGSSRSAGATPRGFHLVRQDGRCIDVQVEALLVVLADRTVTRLLLRATTAAERTQQTLQETETLLRSVMESSADYILSIDPRDGSILYLNRSTVTGKTTHDYLGTSIFDVLNESSARVLRECVDRVLATGGNGACEVTFDHPDTGLHYFDVTVGPVVRDGQVASLTINSRDITARKQAERALRDREQKLRILIEQLPAILWTTDRDLIFTSCRGAGLRTLRLHLDEIVGETLARFLDTGLPHATVLRNHVAALRGKSIDFETVWKNRTYQLHLEPLRAPDGEIQGVMGLAFDVTRRKRTSEALRRAHEQLELVTASIPDGLWSVRWDARQGYHEHFHSPVMARITGRPFAFFHDRPEQWLRTVHAEDRSRVGRWFDELRGRRNREAREEQEYRIILPDGSLRWVQDSVVVRSLPDGGVQLHGVVADITDRKEAERQARQHLEELAHAGRLSTMGELVASIAHEINQPLYAITNYAAACRHSLEDPDATRLDNVREWTAEICVQAERVAYIISRLANFVRKASVNHAPLRIDDLIDDSLDLLAFELRAQDVQIEKSLAQPAPTIRGNQIELQQIMVNLLRNACDAMREVPLAERHLVIRAEQLGERVRVHIRDVGHGFGDTAPNRVFEPFFTTKSRGMGLGLAISRSIIESHDGRLWATPNDGRGATFHFELPVCQEDSIESKDESCT